VCSEFARLATETPLPEPDDEIELIEQELDDEVPARLADLQGVDGNPEDRVFRKHVFNAI
jgi:hypothetical protein